MNPINYLKYSFFSGTWFSEKKIEEKDHLTNLSNWTDAFPIIDYYKFKVSYNKYVEAYMGSIGIPVEVYGKKDYFSIVKGEFVIDKKELIFLQNKDSIKIEYQMRFNQLILHLHGKKLVFKKSK